MEAVTQYIVIDRENGLSYGLFESEAAAVRAAADFLVVCGEWEAWEAEGDADEVQDRLHEVGMDVNGVYKFEP